ncbi:TPA_asm: hypothetical protein G0E33_08695 [Salmonella enterica]|nr:hypothetical protein [Salmonella enterica]
MMIKMEEVEKIEAPESEMELQNVVSHKIKDRDLVLLVRMANAGVEIGITLLSKGVMISGLLVSGKSYYEDCVKKMSAAGSTGQGISEYFSQAQELYEPSEDKEIPLNFLHLKDAVILTGQNRTSYNGAIFRIKIEEIDGFFIGNIQA